MQVENKLIGHGPKTYRDLFIDFDDTLYDTHGNAQIALAELFDLFHWNQYFPTLEAFTEPYWLTNFDLWSRYARGEITRDYLVLERFRRPLSEGQGLNPTPAYCMKVSDAFLDLCSQKPGTLEGAHPLMRYLKAKGYRLHMASNGFHEVQYKKLRASGMDEYFDTVILSDDAGANKPSAAFFDYALRVADATRDASLMIGDNLQTDISGAHAVGLDQIWFNPYGWPCDLSFTPTHTVAHLSEIMELL